MYAIIVNTVELIKSIKDAQNIDIIRFLVNLFFDFTFLILAIINNKYCDFVGVKYIKSKKLSILVMLIMPLWSVLFNFLSVKHRMNSSQKICRNCGAATQAKYTVCWKCKTADDFILSDESLPKITAIYKNKILPFSIITISMSVILTIFNFIMIYLGV